MEDSSDKAATPQPFPGDPFSDVTEPQPLPSTPDFPEKLVKDQSPGTLNRWDILFLVVLFGIAFFAVILTGRGDYGLSWDEEYYYGPSRAAAEWVSKAIFDVDRPFSPREIAIGWSEIKELPSVVKLSLGAYSLVLGGYMDSLTAFRLPSALAYAATLVLIYIFMLHRFDRPTALFALFAYALMPRIFGHAHLAASESITVLVSFLVVICFLNGLKKARWSLILGIVFGLALNTRITCLFIPLILLPWAHIYRRKSYVNNFFAMVFLSPVIMVLTWPWLWRNSAVRLLEYLYFFVSHQFTAVYYLGEKYNYGSRLAPWHYPFVMTFLTLPPVVLASGFVGTAVAVRHARKRPLPVLFLWGAFVFLFISALPSSPKYDGVRLFIPAFLFIALVGAVGFREVLLRLPKARAIHGAFYWRDVACVLGVALVIACGAIGIWRSHPYSLSYYNILGGGMQGAFKKGMQTTFWGEAVNQEVWKVLNELPRGAKIKTLALHDEVFDRLQTWDKLREDLRFNKDAPPFDYHLLLIRRGFFARPEWCLYLNWPRFKVFRHQEVPLVILFKTGAEFEKVWPQFKIKQRKRPDGQTAGEKT